ncbi:MAG: hypothetical protein NTV52_04025 [Acidobacteria bacterium]|nr:hypothetical protein [Acidobacteriota bacterium]
MEVYLTQEQESQLGQIARHEGRADVGELLTDAALTLLAEDARFCAAVLEGKACAERGEFLEEEAMDAHFERMLRP